MVSVRAQQIYGMIIPGIIELSGVNKSVLYVALSGCTQMVSVTAQQVYGMIIPGIVELSGVRCCMWHCLDICHTAFDLADKVIISPQRPCLLAAQEIIIRWQIRIM